MKYKSKRRALGTQLVQSGFFGADKGGGRFMKKPRSFVLKDGCNNLYPDIRTEALSYFEQNKIVWWNGRYPTGHVLASQISCLNHLFPIRQEKEAVMNLLRAVSKDFVDVFPIRENMQGYIQFEAVGGHINLLNEGRSTRGINCTSIDALIYALHRDGKRFLIPIEWKYVETYRNQDKSVGNAGKTRKGLYTAFIENSRFLNDDTFSCCWYEPFYQLMRQTILIEQIILRQVEGIEAEDYLHIHVIPYENHELLSKKYPCSGKGMSETWKGCLKHPEKYVVISPEQLWSKQKSDTDIYRYLKDRYW